MATSRLQRQVSALLSIHLGQYTIRENHRPEWLDGLELDFYIEELSIGIEVQGQQHFEYVPYFHTSYAEFLAMRERDTRKADLCHIAGIELYYVESGCDILPLIEQLADTKLPTIIHPNMIDEIHLSVLEHYQNHPRKKPGQNEAKKDLKFLGLMSKIGLACKSSNWTLAKRLFLDTSILIRKKNLYVSKRHARKLREWQITISIADHDGAFHFGGDLS